MNDESYIKPFLKWAGGKRRLLPEIRKRLPEDIKDCLYCEPFIGGGAVLLDLQPKRAIINDCNCELINCFQMVKQSPEKLVKELETYENTPEFFYSIRSLDQQPGLHALTDIQRAARIIYLNRTCFNGLYRVNSQGYFNTPFGQYKHPVIANKPVIMAVSEYLNTANVKIVLFHRPEAAAFRCVCLSGSSIPSRQVHRSPPIPLKDGTRKTSFVLGTLAGLWIKEVSVF